MRVNGLSVLAAMAVAMLGCTSNQPEAVAAAVSSAAMPAASPTGPTPATQMAPANPTPASPTPVIPTSPVSPRPPAELAEATLSAGSCDLTGTWRLKIVSGADGCGDFADEHIDLALAAVGPANAIAGAARSEGKAGPFGATLPDVRVASYTAPDVTCGLRVRLGAGPGPHVELLLHREGEGLRGQGSLWSTREGAPCRHAASVFGENIAAQPQPWSALTAANPWLRPAAAKPASSELVAATRKITARSILGGAAVDGARVKLRGSIVDYVAAVVETPRAVTLYEVPCTAAAEPRCVAIVGDPCRPAQHIGEDCEGMYLTVVIAPRSGKLDRIDAGEAPVETQADVEQRLDEAP